MEATPFHKIDTAQSQHSNSHSTVTVTVTVTVIVRAPFESHMEAPLVP